MTYIEFILDPDRIGMFLCQLESIGGCKKHVIGVDCYKQVILDSSESNAINLSRENLDYCCGKYLLGVNRIVYCYELLKN